jgi:peptidoglycan-associated lipoprotein
MKMRNNVWFAIAFVTIFPAMLFPVSCAKKEVVQTPPAFTTQPESLKTADRSADDAEQAKLLKKDKLRIEAAAREAARSAFISENIPFAFDSSLLSQRAQQILETKAEYLHANAGVLITVEGHCDERGTDAYNLALGERRAESVKIFLVTLGIDADRLNTVTYGEERPIAIGHNEESWAKNRRAQFKIN